LLVVTGLDNFKHSYFTTTQGLKYKFFSYSIRLERLYVKYICKSRLLLDVSVKVSGFLSHIELSFPCFHCVFFLPFEVSFTDTQSLHCNLPDFWPGCGDFSSFCPACYVAICLLMSSSHCGTLGQAVKSNVQASFDTVKHMENTCPVGSL